MLQVWALGRAFIRWRKLLLLSGLPLAAAAQRPAPPPFKAPAFRGGAAPAPAAGTTTVSGHVDEPTARVISLSYGPDWRGHLTQTVEARLTAQGNFRLVLPRLAAPAEVRLGYDNTYATLYLEPGDDLRLTFDPSRLEQTLAFTGRGANANNYLTQSALAASQDDEAGRTPDARAGRLSAADLRRTADAYRQRRLAALAAYAAARPLPAAFMRQQRQALSDEWASSLLSYFSRQSAERRQGGYATLPVGYYDFLGELRLANQDSALTQSAFQSLLMTYGFTQLNDEDGNLPTGREAGRRLYQRATEALGDGRVRDVAVGQYLLGKVESEHTDIRPLLPDFRAHNHDSTIARAVRQAVRAHLALANGQPAPDFTLLDASGKKIALSSLRGKIVYLDFWATWCAPCLAEMPASLELRKKFAGRDVVFLYVSLDSQAVDWQKYLATKQVASPNAVQLHDGGAFDGPAPKAFNVQSIPSYWLIGRDGRIIANNPPRPSTSPAIDTALEQALKP
ncbi:TlpA family protein disulfide reductase [Hymenobacter cheonanensis]|uniref:TlpA family protein disulfide reductase n=1 Tax=Hymenobacter sp. CA2-7 TaxID=3063993 RepID=UPI0027126BF2|nr:TlpA disulfide reductase family protein [Hymenobacter sp. CA2-7]MDO7887058.1 TlpA disulfide reductase family protein [Hymenobacter sp. CA2-7]